MIHAFLYLDLTTTASFQKVLPGQVQQALPAVAVLDVDAKSGELVLHYALRLLRESQKAVIYIDADATAAGFGTIMPLLEELFQSQENRLVLLAGEHPRLLRMFQARPQVLFKQVKKEAVLQEVEEFLKEEAL